MTKSSRQSYISIDARKSRRSFEEDFDFDIDEDSDSESDNWESDASSDSNDDSSNNDSDSSGSQNEYKREWDNKNKNKERDDNEDEYSDSSDDSDNDSQWKEDQKTKQKIFAILLTVVCLILLASAIGLGVAMSQKSDETQVDKSTALQSPTTTPVVTSMPTSNATTFAPSSAPSNPTTLTPTVSPTVDTFANETSCDGGNETSCGDEALAPDIFENYFNVSEDSVIPYDPYAIPGEIVVNPSGDTYVLALPEGEVVVREPGAPPEDFGTSPTLLVRSRNSVDGTIPVEDWEVGNFAGSNSTGDEDGNEDGSEDGDEEDKVGLLPANASSYALLNFNMEAYPWFNNTNADLRSKTTKAYLCLYQKTHSNEVDPWGNSRMNETSGNFTKKRFAVCRVENAVGEDLTAPEGKAPTGADVEQIAPGVANYSMPEDCMDGLVARTFVVPDVSMVCIDASPFVNKYPPFVDDPYAVVDDESSVVEDDDVVTSEIPVRHRYLRKKKKDKNKQETSSEKRNLQEDAESIVDRSNYKNLLFMIAYIEKGRDASAEFYSREKNETVAPVLIWQFDESAAPSESPTMTPGPTDLTTAGPQPSSIPTLAPSTSSIPTLVPSTTNTIELSNSTNEDNFDSNSTTPDQGVDEDASLEDGNVTVGEEDEEFLEDGNVTVAEEDGEFLGDGNTTVGEEDGEFLGDGNVTVAEEDGEFLGDGNTTVGEEDEQFLGDGNVTVTAEDGNTTVGIDDEDLPGNETTTLVATMDTYFSPSKGGQPELPGLEETLLVQNGEPSYEETNALVSFNINIDPLPNEASFCLEHVPTRPTSTVDTRTYTTCMVPYIDDIETLTGTDISYTMPESCIGELSAEFVVSPLTERICTDVSSFFLQPGGFQEGAGTKTILFMIANLVADEEAGDRFYSISDPLERYPTLEFSSGVLVI